MRFRQFPAGPVAEAARSGHLEAALAVDRSLGNPAQRRAGM